MTKNRREKRNAAAYARRHPERRPHPRLRRGFIAAFALLLCVAFPTRVKKAEAATIGVGSTPTDTAIRDDGLEAYVLNSGASTLSIIDTATGTVTSTVNLAQGSNVALDIDWQPVTGRVLVGCTNGKILAVDPSTGTKSTLANVSGADFGVICADTWLSGTVAWAINRNTNWIYQITSSSATAVVSLGISSAVELAEKKRGASSSTYDKYLYALGSNGSTARVARFDRSSSTVTGGVTYPVSSATGTGIATSSDAQAFVTANIGTSSKLYVLDLSTMAFASSALGSYSTNAPDVTVAGQFVLALVKLSTGAQYQVYDIGDPSNILFAGTLTTSSSVNAAGGLSSFMRAGGALDDIYTIYANAASSATAQDFAAAQATFVDATPPSVTSALEPLIQSTLSGIPDQEARPCAECDGQTGGITSGAVAGDGYSEPFSASAASVEYSTGEEVFRLPLFSVPGIGVDLPFQLTYRSRRGFDYRYGNGWFLNQDARTVVQTNSDQRHYDGTGRRDTYVYSSGSYLTPATFDTTMAVASGAPSVTDRFGNVETFNGSGQRAMYTDRYGNSLSYTYTSDELTTVTDTLGRGYVLSYDSQGRLSTISDFGYRTWTFTYDYMGQLRSVTTPPTAQFTAGRTRWFSYSGNNSDARLRSNLVHVWNYRGQVVQTLSYSGDDLVSSESLGTGTYSMTYDAVNSQRTVVDRSGDTTTWTFDSNAMATQVERFTKGLRTGEPASYVTSFHIGSNGYPDYIVNPLGDRIDYTYDSTLNLTEVRHRATNTSTNSSNDIVRSFTYGVYGQIDSATDANGNTTSITLDSLGNPTAIARPTVTIPATQTSSIAMTFDSFGRPTSVTDGESRETDLEYYTSGSNKGWLKKVKRDPSGFDLESTIEYDQFGAVTAVVDARGNRTDYTVDDEGYVTQIEASSPFSFKTKLTYDADRNVTLHEVENKDRTGTADPTTPWIDTTGTYDAMNRLLTATRQLTASVSATKTFTYEGSGLLASVTTAEGRSTAFAYDERKLLFTLTKGYGAAVAGTSQYDYDDNGALATVTDPRTNQVTYSHDAYGRTDRVTNEIGNYTTFAYDKAGNATTIESKDSGGTLFASRTNYYDEVGRLWQVIASRFGSGLTTSSPTTTFTHDKSDRVTQVLDPLSRATTRAFDTAGRPASVTDAVGNSVSYTLDENGNATEVDVSNVVAGSVTPEVFSTQYLYDELNRLTTRYEIDRTNSSNVLTTAYEYDSLGNLTFLADAESHPSRFTYDLARRLVQRERALSTGTGIDDFTTEIVEAFGYDKDDHLTSLTDDNFNTTSYTVDARDRVSATTHADTKQTAATFDANGNLYTWTDQNGTVVTNTWDAHNRLTARSVSRGTGVIGTTAETHTFDALDRMLTAVNDDYQVENSWDSVGNLLQERQGYNSSGNEKWKTVAYKLDDAARLKKITYPYSLVVTHDRDDIGRLTAINDYGASATIASFTWQGINRLQSTTNQNGTSTNYSYDGFGRVSTIDHQLPSSAGSLHKFEYLYDKVHNRRMEKNTYDSSWVSTLPSAVQTLLNARGGKGDVYRYDWANRLVDVRYDVASPATEVGTPGSQTYAKLVTYALDGLGNRSQHQTTVPPGSPVTVTYAADVVNEYTSVGGTSRGHDDNGNVKDDGTYLFYYDFQNRLWQVKLKTTSATVATYKFDALGRRVEKVVSGGATSRFVYDRQNIIEEYDGTDTWRAQYTYEDRLDRPRTMDRADISDVNGNSNTAEVLRYAYHQNSTGSISEVTDPNGAVVERMSFDVFGRPQIYDGSGTQVSLTAIGNAFAYGGREFDVETLTYHLRSRSYDPASGTFLQRDPVGVWGGINLYSYVTHSPANLTDPLGLFGADDVPAPSQGEIDAAVAGTPNSVGVQPPFDPTSIGPPPSPSEHPSPLPPVFPPQPPKPIDLSGYYASGQRVAPLSPLSPLGPPPTGPAPIDDSPPHDPPPVVTPSDKPTPVAATGLKVVGELVVKRSYEVNSGLSVRPTGITCKIPSRGWDIVIKIGWGGLFHFHFPGLGGGGDSGGDPPGPPPLPGDEPRLK